MMMGVKFLGAGEILSGSKVEPFEENFGHRFFVRCDSISFRLQAPIDGEKGPLGQVESTIFRVTPFFAELIINNVLLQVEPYFITLALYDLKLNKKITEDFRADANHPIMKAVIQSLQVNSDEPNPVTDIPNDWLAFPKQVRKILIIIGLFANISIFQAIFNVRHCHSDVFLVVRIETILQGSVVTSAEPYVRLNSDLKTGLKVQKTARSYCSR